MNEPSLMGDLRLISNPIFCSSRLAGSSLSSMSLITIWSALRKMELLGVVSFMV